MQEEGAKLKQQLAVQTVQLANKERELQVSAFDAETKRIQATKVESPNNGPTAIDLAEAQNKGLSATADAALKGAQIDKLQAETVKTLVEAAIAPSAAMASRASNVE